LRFVAKTRERSKRQELQLALGELAVVQPYDQHVTLAHPLVGWWATPSTSSKGCSCRLCTAGRARRDVHLGSISRTAFYEAQRLVEEHVSQAAA
jgi:hypothetical protein